MAEKGNIRGAASYAIHGVMSKGVLRPSQTKKSVLVGPRGRTVGIVMQVAVSDDAVYAAQHLVPAPVQIRVLYGDIRGRANGRKGPLIATVNRRILYSDSVSSVVNVAGSAVFYS